MPAVIGHSKVYCPDLWPEQGYRVQAVYNNTHVWKEMAPKFDELIIKTQTEEIEELNETVANYKSLDENAN